MSYTNPVYPGSCPDPFIIKHRGEYWCYSTGWASDGRAFQILHSNNLVEWRIVGGAMEALPGAAPEYWAPEVSYRNGRFYLYYSVGDGVVMKLRVAVAANPEGPFVDSGRVLTQEEFAIDAHVFEDDNGERYLFYATDFLTHTHIGTGTVADRMIDDLTLAGNPRPVTLPRFDWQVFDPHRTEKGGVRWHTVEGPFVLKRKGRYYQMFSGGNWKDLSYGVSYATADSIASLDQWSQQSHDEHTPLALSTIPGKVVGPGHNSVVRGPDNRRLFCVYHRWALDENGGRRVLAIDPMEWIGERLEVFGPSTEPQETPNRPVHPSFQQISGIWRQEGPAEIHGCADEGSAEAGAGLSSDCFLLEVDLAALPDASRSRQIASGIRLYRGDAVLFSALLENDPAPAITIAVHGNDDDRIALPLPPDFRFDAYHLLRLEGNARHLSFAVDGLTRWKGRVDDAPDLLTLLSEHGSCSFSGCSLTYGFEDLFEEDMDDPNLIGWRVHAGTGENWSIRTGELRQTASDALNSVLVKEHSFTEYELVVTVRCVRCPRCVRNAASTPLLTGNDSDSYYGFYPALDVHGDGPLVRIGERENRTCLVWRSQQDEGAWPLPIGFDRYRAQQFRFKKCHRQLQVHLEDRELGRLPVLGGPSRAALCVHRTAVAFDMVRLTSLQ